jgi:hypothetical protein
MITLDVSLEDFAKRYALALYSEPKRTIEPQAPIVETNRIVKEERIPAENKQIVNSSQTASVAGAFASSSARVKVKKWYSGLLKFFGL